ncbi:MAG: DNA primase regulatory subunit PriL [Methanocalculus sp. MSAO_Arc1]|uniref:DNA primase large subunit PriL n=1 Tax=Methanocalculus TaxID=71151 RepID=UPI000FF0A799|nr:MULTISPECIES: DNA primase large subunit PriL [unclassified Methanocalculus]MCP1661767.1 DNA primase large subunit [Methanocalculus sp. AMF5]RQD79437.1 MAG: DNA primase regulatory subunit PriL [Methanocalculus sp. MSAO_Arc1]
MEKQLDPLYRARYPFLKEASEIIAEQGITLETITNSSRGRIFLDAAVERIEEAVLGRDKETWADKPDLLLDIISYALARVLISCSRNRSGIGSLARYEAKRALYFLQVAEDNEDVRRMIYQELGIPYSGSGSDYIDYTRYIELASGISGDQFRLVNRDLFNGMVMISVEEKDILLRERIRTLLTSQLPLSIPDSVCSQLAESVSRVDSILAEKAAIEYGEIDEAGFPPCIRHLHTTASEGKYLTHSGRFALTTFLHTIGMEMTAIISLFSGGGDFNLDVTTYQVEHITSHDTEGYTTPSCATMKTHGICIGKNKQCETIRHPLNYYRKNKTKKSKKTGSPGPKQPETTKSGETGSSRAGGNRKDT